MTDDVVRAAYSAWANEYAAKLGSMDVMDDIDRQFISGWGAAVSGHIVDAGCGPGHWTDHLTRLGADVEGVDLVPAFVELAKARFPTATFRVAHLDDLGLPDRSVSGILAWYSLIHHEPDRVPVVLGEFARCLEPHGGLVVGFVAGERLEQFPHTVTPAYYWPADELAQRIERAGFRVDEVHTRANRERPDRTHGAVLAHRRDR